MAVYRCPICGQERKFLAGRDNESRRDSIDNHILCSHGVVVKYEEEPWFYTKGWVQRVLDRYALAIIKEIGG